jgi:lipopolysaccharide biosynthesis glycosyltransferase
MSTWTKAVYYRLYFPLLLKSEIQRFIYLDADTLVLKDLTKFYNLNLNSKPVAAVWDNYVNIQPLIGLDVEGEYFNSGVLLVDIQLWNQQAVSEKTIDYLIKNPEKIKYVDQCALNAVLKNNWHKLSNEYNLLYSYIPQESGIEAYKRIKEETTVIHFTLQRPWNTLCKNRFRSLYNFYFKHSPAKNNKRLNDFSFSKIKDLLILRIKEFYQDHAIIKAIWRLIKTDR